MRRRILCSTGIPVSIGFAPTKSLAKVANRIAKKFHGHTNGVYVIQTEQQRQKALAWLPIGDVWGIGLRHARRLQRMGVDRALKFTGMICGLKRICQSLVFVSSEIFWEPILDLEETQDKKSIATTRSFDKDYVEFEEVKERIVTFASKCAEKLRRQRSVCRAVLVFVRSNIFRKGNDSTGRAWWCIYLIRRNSTIDIVHYAVEALRKIFRPGIAYKKAGVMVLDISPQQIYQTSLFSRRNPRHDILMEAIDEINYTIGTDKIKLASQDQGELGR